MLLIFSFSSERERYFHHDSVQKLRTRRVLSAVWWYVWLDVWLVRFNHVLAQSGRMLVLQLSVTCISSPVYKMEFVHHRNRL